MWGTRSNALLLSLSARFIPTHVGNTRITSGPCIRSTVHPHACGEHWATGNMALNSSGSSPRMWGTLRTRNRGASEMRFIPTHVGNTPANSRGAGCRAVHPHACGEHTATAAKPDNIRGSSPRMWGTLYMIMYQPTSGRFIPTHVGNTRPARRREGPGAVHPHACGEHRHIGLVLSDTGGSSPRMWGTRSLLRQHTYGQGFIPTHVGNTRGSE